MKNLILILLLLWMPLRVFGVNVKISDLPLGSASTTGVNDSFPYVDSAQGITKKMTVWDIANIPTLTGGFVSKSLTENYVVVGNSSNLAAGVPLSGDATIVSSGALTVNSVGGSTASAVNTATVAANAAASANTAGQIVKRDGSGNFSAGTVTAALIGNVTGDLTGNASTATALAANPTDCSSDQYANAIAANGDLTCSQVTTSQLSGTITNSQLAGSIALSKLAATTASRAIVSDGSGVLTPATTTATEIGYVNGVTSAIQTQLDAKQARSTLTTKGDLYCATGSATVVRLPLSGVNGNVLTEDSAQTCGITWSTPAATPVNVAPIIQNYSAGSGTHNRAYAFIISSGSATAGATYTNNGVTYTVFSTVSSATLVYMTGSGSPASSGTLTKTSGTGDSTLTFSQAKTPLYYRIRMVGAGGGGSGAGTASGGNGSSGSAATTWNVAGGAAFLTANAGSPGTFTQSQGGNGGSATISSPAYGLAFTGNGGQGYHNSLTSGAATFGGAAGGAGCFSSGSGAIVSANTSGVVQTNQAGSGSGGAGAANGTTGAVNFQGTGGGAGGCIYAIVPSPAAQNDYVVATGGAGGSAGTNGGSSTGGAGGDGLISVESVYQ